MKYSDKYKANAFMVAGLSCVWPLGNAFSNLLIKEPAASNTNEVAYWISYTLVAMFGILMVYAAYKECKSKEGNNYDIWID